jgi:predicted adenylyl cyclase CyaB
MPANIEIKAIVRDFNNLRKKAEALSDTPAQIISQEDTFFKTKRGRLKLRQLGPNHGQLVYYERTNVTGPKRSEYFISDTNEPATLKTTLTAALGVRGIIRKKRTLFLAGQTRIHLDEVEELGKFMELEVVLRQGQSDAEGLAITRDLMDRLGIQEEDLLGGAYLDLLERK